MISSGELKNILPYSKSLKKKIRITREITMKCCTQHVVAQFLFILPNRLSCSRKYFTFESLSIIYETENVPKKTEYIPDIIWECSLCYDQGIPFHSYIYFVSQVILWYLLLQRWYRHYQFLLQNTDLLLSTWFNLTELSSQLWYRISPSNQKMFLSNLHSYIRLFHVK